MSEGQISVRPVILDDRHAVHRLALTNRMFGPDELEGLDQTLSGYLDHSRPDDRWVVAMSAREGGDVAGAAYFAPEPFADRVWNLFFLAVDPAAHRQGVGTVLVQHVVGQLQSAGDDIARILLVETSSAPAYQQARSFYAARGFDVEARIRDYYGPGDDKVVFWRRLR